MVSLKFILTFWVTGQIVNLQTATAFSIVNKMIEPEDYPRVGGSVLLKCHANEWYEFCTWSHRDKICNFEWKRNHAAVKMQTCPALRDRVNFVGNYEVHECAVKIDNVTLADEGEWKCEMERYIFGAMKGSTATDTLQLHVLKTTDVTLTPTLGENSPNYDNGEEVLEYQDEFTGSSSTFTSSNPDTTPSSTTDFTFSVFDDTISSSTTLTEDYEMRDLSPKLEPDTAKETSEIAGNNSVAGQSLETEEDYFSMDDIADREIPLVAILVPCCGVMLLIITLAAFMLHRKNKGYDVTMRWNHKRKDSDADGEETNDNVTKKRLELAAFANESASENEDDDLAKESSVREWESKVVYDGSNVTYNMANEKSK